MVLRKLGALDPEGDDFLLPLPFQQVQEIRRPRGWRPVRVFGIVRIARASGEVDDSRDAQFFSQQDSLPAGFLVRLRNRLVGMQRVAMATQGADADALVVKFLLEVLKLRGLLQPLQLEMGIARVVAGSQLEGMDTQWFYLLDDFVQTKLGQERRKESDLHIVSPFVNV